ncbi:MAG TPA: HAMP domain-containing sensor histidine kinase [Polyangia bacterium]|jgi:two-component system phosphate regulon sensor histidine kinase PhoR|nr:HAMP domain-containing sensor histidine kinase [Polyangia bacterium]
MLRQGSRISLILALVFPAIICAAVALAYYGYRYAVAASVRSKASLMEGNQQLAQLLISQVQDRIDSVDYDFFQKVEWEDRLSRPTPEIDLSPAVESFVILDENLKIRSQFPAADPRRRKPEIDRWQNYVRGLEWKSLQPWTADQAGNFRHLHQLFDGRSVLIAYAAKETALGARYYIAAKLNLGLITKEWIPELVEGLATKRRIVILDEVARSIVGGPSIQRPSAFLYEESFGKTLYAWRVQITPLNADELRAQAETERLLGVLLIPVSTVIIAVGLGVVWLSVRAERRASRLKSDFIANVSHELKTPLSLIRMFAELLATGKHKGERVGREYASIITRESDRLAHLIDNVLDFARLERGKASYNFAEGRMQEVVERALEVCRYRLDKEKIRLRTEIAADLPLCRIDEDAMSLVLLNLVDNAAKYSGGDPGGDTGHDAGDVLVRLARAPGGVALSVHDRGSGISSEDQKRIFERFYRADNARVHNVRGSGIGLSLVKHIAEAHGGRVEVESAPGQGATFTVFVPAAPLATAERADVSGVQLELPVASGSGPEAVGMGVGVGVPVPAAHGPGAPHK